MIDPTFSIQTLVPQLVALAHRAGEAVMKFYYQEDLGVTYKDFDSPLTCADVASHHLIVEHLHTLTPNLPVLSEESQTVPYDERQAWRTFWLVDPLDGTKEFINRNGEFTVNIALVQNSRPILGVVHAPAMDVTYFAAEGVGAFKHMARTRTHAICVRRDEPARLKVVVSRSHPSKELDKLLLRIGPHECIGMGSSLKICLVAEGEAHLYPRLGPTMEWDTAAAQCIAEMAGGAITDSAGQTLRYNKADLHNPDFIVSGIPDFPWYSYFENGVVDTDGDKHAE
jgi:3'(2'), 5'-bisphosphate nucleotidase